MSLPQQQIGYKQSRKLCLNLWSLRWLKPNLSLVISFIPVGLWQLKVLLGVGRMNCKNALLQKSKTFRTSYAFIKIIPLDYRRREEQVIKKSMFDIEPRNVADIISCSISYLSGGDFIKQMLSGLIFS